MLLTDTVGFVRRLPHGLVEAFKSTLEVVAEADLLVHLVDASASDPDAQIDAVHAVLAEIGADRVPELIAFNKSDLAPEEAVRLVKLHPGSVAISASTGARHRRPADGRARTVCVRSPSSPSSLVPYDRGDVLAAIHREGEVLSTAHLDAGVRVRARLSRPSAGRLAEFVVSRRQAGDGARPSRRADERGARRVRGHGSAGEAGARGRPR